ncbi:MAG TPA: cytochrome c oxidase assembly factor Coa1 family protein [Acidobacteriaceae bacterium]
MLSNRNVGALIFLTAIGVIAIDEVAPKQVGIALMVLLVLGIPVLILYKTFKGRPANEPSKAVSQPPFRSASGYLLLLCIATSIGCFCIAEFRDYNGRKLPIFNQSLVLANQSSAASALLGAPIRASWPVKRSGNLSDDAAEVHLVIPVSGKSRRGSLVVDAIKEAKEWKITRLVLIETGTTDTPGASQDITPIS